MKFSAINCFRVLAVLEGSSLLILLLIAMPYRAFTQDHRPVRMTGMAHGILFMMYVFTLVVLAVQLKWGWKKSLLGFIAASIPLGTFAFDWKYLRNHS